MTNEESKKLSKARTLPKLGFVFLRRIRFERLHRWWSLVPMQTWLRFRTRGRQPIFQVHHTGTDFLYYDTGVLKLHDDEIPDSFTRWRAQRGKIYAWDSKRRIWFCHKDEWQDAYSLYVARSIVT